jgi:hypothetical protein
MGLKRRHDCDKIQEIYDEYGGKEYENNQTQIHGSINVLPAGSIGTACHGGSVPGDGGGGGNPAV